MWVCSLYQSTHTHPVPNGQCKCKSRVRAVGVVECGGCPRFFLVGSCGDSAPGFSLFSFSFDRIFIRHLSTNSDNFFTMTKRLTYRQNSHPQNMSISDKFFKIRFFDRMNQIPTNSLFFVLLITIICRYSKSIHFFNRQISSLLSFLFCDFSILL